ncbi:hypothetical protein DVH24_009557 [Malus domestica]|uniref:Uncharacterized protein n=1 Tax=Malus domestica TaxID=3750 RepID=A0A498IQX3_MALDO|nr:hypothetical protein DVH24_009557 [Malus domestica]
MLNFAACIGALHVTCAERFPGHIPSKAKVDEGEPNIDIVTFGGGAVVRLIEQKCGCVTMDGCREIMSGSKVDLEVIGGDGKEGNGSQFGNGLKCLEG